MVRTKASDSVAELVTLIRQRKVAKQKGFLLVLGTNVADAFSNFISAVLGTSQPDLLLFRSRASLWSPTDREAAVRGHLKENSYKIACTQFASLIRAGFFTSVVTTAVDTMLEDALSEVGLKYGEFKVHIFGIANNEQLRSALNGSDNIIHIFKLYGSVTDSSSIKFVPGEQMQILNKYENDLRKLFSQDLVLCGYLDDYDRPGIGQYIPGNADAATRIFTEKKLRDINLEPLKTNLERRKSSIIQMSTSEFLATLTKDLGVDSQVYLSYVSQYKRDVEERLRKYSSTWLERFINLPLSTVPVKMREMNRPYRTGENVETAFDFEKALEQFSTELIAMLGEPGAGKTTLLQQRALTQLQSGPKVPIFVELANYQKGSSVRELILTELMASNISRKNAEELLNLGGFLILLDGLNEVEKNQMAKVARELLNLYRLHKSQNQFVVTCRTAEWLSFLDRDTRRLEVLSVSYNDVIMYLATTLRIDEEVARSIFSGLDASIRQLTHTPLILSMLASVLQTLASGKGLHSFWASPGWKTDLPKNKAALYSKLIDDMLVRDLEENKATIPIPLHHQALMHLARYMKNELLVVEHSVASDIITEFYQAVQAKKARYDVSIEDLVNDVMHTPPVINSKGSVGKFSHMTFMHQSFQEYYTALDIYNRLHGKYEESLTLSALSLYIGVDDKRWWETIILLSGIESDATDLVEYIIARKNLYLAARCIRDSQKVSADLVDKVIVYGLDSFKYDAKFDYDMIYSFSMVFHKGSENLPKRLLDDIDWWLRKYVRSEPKYLHALTDKQLLNSLNSKDESFLIDVVWTIGQRKLETSVRSLLQLLPSVPEVVREQIVIAMGRIANLACKEALLKITQNSAETPWLRAFALNSLGQLKDPELIPELSEYLLDSRNPYRDSAAWALRAINHANTKQALLDALNIQGEDLNEFSGKKYALGTTLFALGDLGDSTVVPYLLNWAERIEDPYILEDLMYAFGQLGDVQSIDYIASQLSNTDAVVRRRAIAALVKLRAVNLVGEIQKLTSDPSPFVREAVEEALSAFAPVKKPEIGDSPDLGMNVDVHAE